MVLVSRYGLVGLLRPLTVYPSDMVYWLVGVHEMVLNLIVSYSNVLFFRAYRLFLSSKVFTLCDVARM